MTKRANYLFIDKQDNEYIVSMTPELQDDIGTVGYVDFSDEESVKKDDSLASIEASKTVMEILSPLNGTVSARNEAAVSEPSLLNSAKQEENWLVKLTDVDKEAFAGLEDA